ncbi:hypothetical protein C7451_101455 [Blastomonas natatoria]|uniref:Lipoprotein n=1 Tax=Blastomonas natatoria TaxID=34015 RepID=A0A2V3VF16_9SPHN|nr:hypothetical protein [Blastomonas natatoria]PXW79388.1 hypothetical protein C7451_101455 [Blastomonas natatoria]
MRNKATAIIGLMGFVATSQAASACDLEGFGYTRINPFAHHAAWNVPSDKPTQQNDSSDQRAAANTADTRSASSTQAQASATDARADIARATFTPVSAESAANQSQRFTATKD